MTVTKDAKVLVGHNAYHPLVRMGLIPMGVVEGTVVTPWETSEQVLERLQRDHPDETESLTRRTRELPMASVLVNATDEFGIVNTYLCADTGRVESVEHLIDVPLLLLVEKFDPADAKWEVHIPNELPDDFK